LDVPATKEKGQTTQKVKEDEVSGMGKKKGVSNGEVLENMRAFCLGNSKRLNGGVKDGTGR